ncbi:MAG: DUF5658 family protein [Dehalococcoidia bacterium]
MANTVVTLEAVATRGTEYTVRGEKPRIVGNAKAHDHIGLVYILLALNALDVLTTYIGLQLGAVEANPLVSGLMGGVGEAATYVIKISVVLAAALLLCKLGKPLALKWLNLGMAAIVTSNLVVFAHSFAG